MIIPMLGNILRLLVIVCTTSVVHAGALPDFDHTVERMAASFAPISISVKPDELRYFNKPIPKIVHQIWFGNRARMCDVRTAQWRAFAERFGYTYRLWSEDDDAELERLLPPENFKILLRLRAGGSVHAASDLLRISLMRRLGGIYCDVDMSPPSIDGNLVDLADIIPMRNIVLLTENFAINVGNSAMFFANGLMMSSTDHPIYQHLENTLPKNIYALYPDAAHKDGPLSDIDAVYATGPGYLSRSVSGVITVLPITYARRLNMVHDGKWDAESGVPFTFDEIGGAQAWQCK